MPYPRPAGEPALRALVGSELSFDADALEIELLSEHLSLPLARADDAMRTVLRDAAHGLLQRERASETSKLEASVRQQLRAGLATGAVDARSIARQLHLSERTLRRRLQSEGLGLRELVDAVRHELAIEQLQSDEQSTEQIAQALGFTTAQAFHRAFRRWTGDTVQAFRAAKRKPAARG